MFKRITCIFALVVVATSLHAQIPVIDVVKNATVKVIKAIDLQVQRWQNETIALQNAQRILENALAELKLREIGDWVDRQRELYADYFEELGEVKSFIADYHRVRSIVRIHRAIANEYASAASLLSAAYFSPDEREYMQRVYTGILDAAISDVQHLGNAITPRLLHMNDGDRLAAIEMVSQSMQSHLTAIQSFNRQNQLLALQRARSADEVNVLRKIHGL